MAQDRDQYVHFTIKLLKGSFALGALWQDALNYHMIDQPDKLIALRLTEYYELVARGALRPGPSMQGVPPSMPGAPVAPTTGFLGNNAAPATVPPTQTNSNQANSNGKASPPKPTNSHPINRANEIVVSSSSTSAEQNAEEAADYWSPL